MAATIEGTIMGGVAYTLAEFEARTGLRRTALRMARHAGLRVIRVHGRAYVRGEDWLAYLAQQASNGDQGDGSTDAES